MYIRNFNEVSPPARNDGVPFITIKVEESSDLLSWNVIEMVDIAAGPGVLPIGLDTNPTKPVKRSITTDDALMVAGSYRLTWIDANGAAYVDSPFAYANPMLTEIETLVRSEMPGTWDGLARDNYLGLGTLRLRIANVKAILLPATIAAQDESTYSLTLRAYIAKSSALDLVGTGIEYWMRQKTSLSATGTNETKSLPDPIMGLRELAKRLTVEIANLAGNPAVTLFSVNVSEAPGISGDGDMVTQDPFAWPIKHTPYNTPGVVVQ